MNEEKGNEWNIVQHGLLQFKKQYALNITETVCINVLTFAHYHIKFWISDVIYLFFFLIYIYNIYIYIYQC